MTLNFNVLLVTLKRTFDILQRGDKLTSFRKISGHFFKGQLESTGAV